MTVLVDKAKCLACGGCVGVCPALALEMKKGTDVVCDPVKCTNCALCVKFCPVGALKLEK